MPIDDLSEDAVRSALLHYQDLFRARISTGYPRIYHDKRQVFRMVGKRVELAVRRTRQHLRSTYARLHAFAVACENTTSISVRIGSRQSAWPSRPFAITERGRN